MMTTHPPFAKLFDTRHGQLLITKEYDDEGDRHGLAARFEGACSMTISTWFADEQSRDEAFANWMQADAERQGESMAATTSKFGGKAA